MAPPGTHQRPPRNSRGQGALLSAITRSLSCSVSSALPAQLLLGSRTSFAHPSLWRDIPRGAAAQSPHWAGHALAALMPGELQTWLTRGSQDCHPGHAGTACTLLKPEQNALRPNAVVAGSFPGSRHPALGTRPSW